jgi:serine/threonine protein kinase
MIGSGKYSEVYLGTDKRTGEKVVVKVLLPRNYEKLLREI